MAKGDRQILQSTIRIKAVIDLKKKKKFHNHVIKMMSIFLFVMNLGILFTIWNVIELIEVVVGFNFFSAIGAIGIFLVACWNVAKSGEYMINKLERKKK